MGKIDVGIEADADLRRDQQAAHSAVHRNRAAQISRQILNERMQLIADDLRLLMVKPRAAHAAPGRHSSSGTPRKSTSD